jgi:hypothetical protein
MANRGTVQLALGYTFALEIPSIYVSPLIQRSTDGEMKSIAIGILVLLTLVASPASASTINLTVGAGGGANDHILGEVFTRKDFQGGQAAVDTEMVNGLLAVALGVRAGADPEYYRSVTDFGSLDAATSTGALTNGGETSLILNQLFQYLVVGYNGKHGGSQVYYIGDLNIGDTINLVALAYPDGVSKNSACGGATEPDCGHLKAGDYYALTHSTFLNPTTRQVPDGGITISLLGMAMAGMGLLGRRIKK